MKSASYICVTLSLLFGTAVGAPVPGLKPIEPGVDDVLVFTDTSNVYVLKDRTDAILIDLGDAGVLDHLGEVGVKNVEAVLFTAHHRELCQGFEKLKARFPNVQVLASEQGRTLFEKPTSFRKMKPSLKDEFTVHGASFVRPPVTPIQLSRGLDRVDTFSWHGYSLSCIQTHGASPEAMSYVLRHGGKTYIFSGDVMVDGAHMHTWYDTDWDYSFGAGVYALEEAVDLLADLSPDVLLPAHGPTIAQPAAQLKTYAAKLARIEKLVLRTYHVVPYLPSDQDRLSKPTAISNLRQVSPHMFKFRGTNYKPNCTIILSDSGHALLSDCGIIAPALLDESLAAMKKQMGLKQVDAVVISHMHGDHCGMADYLREHWGAKVWTLDRIADKLEHPERYNYCALIESYGIGVDSVPVDRKFKPGEGFDWEGMHFAIDHMPGQTINGCCLQGLIDGKLVAFTGDNIFGNPHDPNQNGHEAICAYNDAIPDEGYIVGAEYLSHLKPDLLMGGHSWVMDQPAEMIERYRKWAYDLRDALRDLSSESDYRYWFDPYWVRADPYRVTVERGKSIETTISIRNFLKKEQSHRIRLDMAAGLKANPPILIGAVQPETRQSYSFRLIADKDCQPGVKVVAFDIELDGIRKGELFDMVVEVK